MIQPYVIFFHPNSKIWPCNANAYVGVSVAYLPKACIHQYYYGVRMFWKNLKIKVVMCKTEGLVKCPIVYLINIKFLLCHMARTCFKQNLKWWWKQCVNIHLYLPFYSRKICYQTSNTSHIQFLWLIETTQGQCFWSKQWYEISF